MCIRDRDTYSGVLDTANKNSYIKNRMKIELELFEYKDAPIIHELLTKFFVLEMCIRDRPIAIPKGRLSKAVPNATPKHKPIAIYIMTPP